MMFYFELFYCLHYFAVKNEIGKRNKRKLGFLVDLELNRKKGYV